MVHKSCLNRALAFELVMMIQFDWNSVPFLFCASQVKIKHVEHCLLGLDRQVIVRQMHRVQHWGGFDHWDQVEQIVTKLHASQVQMTQEAVAVNICSNLAHNILLRFLVVVVAIETQVQTR
jgi:hypothetical protein